MTYCFEVTVKWVQKSEGKNKREAIENLKESFELNYDIQLEDKEIKEIKG